MPEHHSIGNGSIRLWISHAGAPMIYTPLTYKAMRICYEAHKDVLDKNGAPYVFHPFIVAQSMDDEISTCVALLHDVVEDTEFTFDDLRKEGMPDEVIDALVLLTHDEYTPYMEYIEGMVQNPISVKVKLSDLAHNMDETRYCRPMNDYERERQMRYQRARERLLRT